MKSNKEKNKTKEIIIEVMKRMGMFDTEPYLSARRDVMLEQYLQAGLPINCWIKIYHNL